MAVSPADSPYWNPKTETLPRADLRALQLAKLRRVVDWASARSPHYRRTLAASNVTVDALSTWDDLRRIPFLTRQDWMDSQAAAPPYGELPVAGPDAAVRLHTTSGTTGREPLRALDSRKDWTWAAEMFSASVW